MTNRNVRFLLSGTFNVLPVSALDPGINSQRTFSVPGLSHNYEAKKIEINKTNAQKSAAKTFEEIAAPQLAGIEKEKNKQGEPRVSVLENQLVVVKY